MPQKVDVQNIDFFACKLVVKNCYYNSKLDLELYFCMRFKLNN